MCLKIEISSKSHFTYTRGAHLTRKAGYTIYERGGNTPLEEFHTWKIQVPDSGW